MPPHHVMSKVETMPQRVSAKHSALCTERKSRGKDGEKQKLTWLQQVYALAFQEFPEAIASVLVLSSGNQCRCDLFSQFSEQRRASNEPSNKPSGDASPAVSLAGKGEKGEKCAKGYVYPA